MPKSKLLKTLGTSSLAVYSELGGQNFTEKEFQIALGYELNQQGIEYLRETHIELFYKNIPIKLGAPDFFLNKEKSPAIIEIKLGASLNNSNRQQLKMYLLSIKKNPRSVLKKVKRGILINFLKDNPLTFEKEELNKDKEVYLIEIEIFTLDKNNELKLLESDCLGQLSK